MIPKSIKKIVLILLTIVFAINCEAQVKTVYKFIIDNTIYDIVYDTKGKIIELNCKEGLGEPRYKFSYEGDFVTAYRLKYSSFMGINEWYSVYSVKTTCPTSSCTKIDGEVYGSDGTSILSTYTLTKNNLNYVSAIPDLAKFLNRDKPLEWENNSIKYIKSSLYPQGDADIIFEYGNVMYNSKEYSLDWLCLVIDRICFNENETLFNYWQNSPFPPFSFFPSKIIDKNRNCTNTFEYKFENNVTTIETKVINDENELTLHTAIIFFK